MSERADVTAARLAARISELQRALGAAGARPGDAGRLLELAAVATIHAVELEELAAARPEPPLRAAQPEGAPRLILAA